MLRPIKPMQCGCSCLICLENEAEAQCAGIMPSAPTAVQQHWAQAFKGEWTEKQVVVGKVQKYTVLYKSKRTYKSIRFFIFHGAYLIAFLILLLFYCCIFIWLSPRFCRYCSFSIFCTMRKNFIIRVFITYHIQHRKTIWHKSWHWESVIFAMKFRD